MKWIFLFISLVISTAAFSSGKLAQEGAFVPDTDKKILNQLIVNTDLIFDHVSSQGFEVYGPQGLYRYLDRMNISYQNLNELQVASLDYPSPDEIVQGLENLHAQYPELTQIINIGKTVQGRSLLVLKISNRASVDQHKPEFKYISSMHGDEITGRELMMRLAKDLLAAYGKDEDITNLIDKTEIFIMPSMNPDGSYLRQRGNARGYDLNRSFPEFIDGDQDSTSGRQPEVAAVMDFQSQRNFAMSANFHGGAEVVSYMWDAQYKRHPFDSMIIDLALDYTSRVDYMKNSYEFQRGITNGYDWYQVKGGMQDWSYIWHNDLQFTIELSYTKWPPYSSIDSYYAKNKAALIQFIRDIHMGAGFYLDQPDVSGEVAVYKKEGNQKINLGTYQFRHSEFYKVLPVGDYSFEILASGQQKMRVIDVRVQKPTGQYSSNYTLLE